MLPDTIQKQLQRIVDSITDGIIIFSSDGIVTFLNGAAEIILGLSPGVLLGKPYNSEALLLRDIEAVQILNKEHPFIKTIQTRRELRNLQYQYKRSDDVIAYLQIDTSLLFDEKGAIQSVVLLLRDMTRIKEHEAQLEQLSLAVQYSPNPVIITDVDAVIKHVNPRFTELTGYTYKEAIGQNPRILKSDLTPQSTYDELWDVLPRGEVWRGEFINKMKNGNIYRQKSAIASAKNAEGEITHYVAVIEDVTKQREAEAALIESERRLKEILERDSLIAVMIDIDGILNYANKLFLDLVNLPGEAIIGKSLYSFVVPEESEKLQRTIIQSVTQDKTLADFEWNFMAGYDELRGVLFSNVPLHNPQGEIVGVACIGEDITERKKAAQEIRESRKQVLDILESISDAFFALDNLWRFTYINRNAERFFEMNRIELLYRDFWKSLPRFIASKLCKNCHKTKEEMKPDSFEEFYPFLGKWFEVRVFPYENGVSVYLSDITQRKNFEEERDILLNRLQSVIDSTYEGIYRLDIEGRCTLFNASAAKMTGYSPEEALGKDMHLLIHHSHQDGSPYQAEECPIIRAGKEGQAVHIDTEVFWRKDGSSFPIEYASYPIHNNDTIQGSVVTFTDISTRQRECETSAPDQKQVD